MFSIRRYLEIIIISILSIVFLDTTFPIICKSEWFSIWSDFYMNLNTYSQAGFYFIIGIIINKLLLLTGDYSEKQEDTKFIFRLRYPPIRYAVILSGIFYILNNIQTSSLFIFNEILNLFFIFIGLSWGFKNNLIKNKTTILNKKEDKQNESISDFSKWITTEKEIKNQKEDLFNRAFIVDRIVNRLEGNESKTLRGQSILGEYGCGKSSVIKLIEERLLTNNQWIICNFDSWGRINNGTQGQKLILEKIIEEINSYTGVSSVQSLPKDYINSLNGIGSWWKNIMSFLYKTELDPNSQLDKIEFILNTLNKKVIIFIEDIDRNNDSDKLANSISPLLDRLVNVSNIHFIFTIGYKEHISSVITRITNFREDLIIDDVDIDNLLCKFRTECLLKSFSIHYLDGFNYLGNWPIRDGIFIKNKSLKIHLNHKSKNAYNAIKFYSKNPRDTKYYFRHVYELWTNDFAGEVNFDDLLIMNLLKQCEPLAYDFIISNINFLNNHNSIDYLSSLEEKWDNITSKLNNIEHSKNLINYLFDYNLDEDNKEYNQNLNLNNMRLQAIGMHDGKNKYFEAIVKNYIPHDVILDQSVITDLINMSNELSNKIIESEFITFNSKYKNSLKDNYLTSCMKFDIAIQKDNKWLVFLYLSQCSIITNPDNIKIHNDLIKKSLNNINRENDNFLQINGEVLNFSMNYLLKKDIIASITLLEIFESRFEKNTLNIIIKDIPEIFFKYNKDIIPIYSMGLNPNEFYSFINKIKDVNKETIYKCYNLLSNTTSNKPEINILFLSQFIKNKCYESFNLYFSHDENLQKLKYIIKNSNKSNLSNSNVKCDIELLQNYIDKNFISSFS